jgi:hypothetical protein
MHENDAPSLYPALPTLIYTYLSLSFRRQSFKMESVRLKELHKFVCTDFWGLGKGGLGVYPTP